MRGEEARPVGMIQAACAPRSSPEPSSRASGRGWPRRAAPAGNRSYLRGKPCWAGSGSWLARGSRRLEQTRPVAGRCLRRGGPSRTPDAMVDPTAWLGASPDLHHWPPSGQHAGTGAAPPTRARPRPPLRRPAHLAPPRRGPQLGRGADVSAPPPRESDTGSCSA
ncbi:hypothetical protein P7K49_026211 [Saguinus oedipus]|uniref:Uncharacterized protein n=1 Tax=Saguinus oedipus TaxID=9490 RepID=A0ABQ9UDD5_SAGOE|nr:hypothetical protein P7K49_026211 [Saguinus oedipus]